MKQLREQIKKEITSLMEKRYPIPPEIKMALVRGLGLRPLIRYVAALKAVNSVPPSYRVFFHNNQSIDLYMEQIGIKVLINNKTYWVTMNGDIDQEAMIAKKELNRVLTQPIPVSSEEETDEGGEEGGEEEMEPEAGDEEGGEEEA